MEHTIEHSFDAEVWAPERKNNHGRSAEYISVKGDCQKLGDLHACRASRRNFQQARDRLRRANRDLGETAAFIAASLTTVTAIQAVITIAKEKLELSKEILKVAFDSYIVILILIFLLGALRANSALRRRARAEREIDQTKKGIFDFCAVDEWLKIEE